MKKINTSPLSGTLELLPRQQLVFDDYKRKIEEVYKHHGFLRIETPTIDRAEVLFAKAGGETEKQIYRIVKTEETADGANEALRFDHTVPLARYTVEHENELDFPFKVSQVARNYRGERAQKGRYREFYQCDIDIIGRDSLAEDYDAEVILTLSEAYNALGLAEKIVRISNRKILAGLLEALNLQEKGTEILRIIDRSEKVTPEKTRGCLEDLAIEPAKIEKILDFCEINGPRKELMQRLQALGVSGEKFETGVAELDRLLKILESFDSCFRGDMRIVRGLDYYTGTVFETFLPAHREIGSIGGGGRYENLVGLYSDKTMPGVGGSIGLSRLFYVLGELGKVEQTTAQQKPLDLAIVPVSEAEVAFALKVAQDYRQKGQIVDVVLTEKKLANKLKYAAKLARQAIVLGEAEVKTGEFQIKEFLD